MTRSPLAILVVDDEPTNLEVAAVILRGAGFEVGTAQNGAEAVARCLENPPRYGLVLMDLLMPVLDGIEATRQLRSHSQTEDIPVILVSAKPAAEVRKAVSETGAEDFLQKPYRRGVLLDKIRSVTGLQDLP